MKVYLLTTACALATLMAQAQSISFINGGIRYSFPAEGLGEMVFSGSDVTVGPRVFDLNVWNLMQVTDEEAASSTVEISWSGTSATVTIAGDIAEYVEAEVNGAHVTLRQSELAGADTSGEITYILRGESADGSLTLTGSYKSTIELHGLALHNPSGAVFDIKNGKRIAISAKNGTVNSLSDGAGSQKGAISCTGHLEFKGKGSLTVKGNSSHAVYAKEYVEIKNLELNIDGAVKDGINCAQYFMLESGAVNISPTGDDGIQVSHKDDTDRGEEDTGSLTVAGGTLTVTITADAAKCLKADGDVTISGGKLNLRSNADGVWDSAKSKTKASACIGADGDVLIAGGELTLRATGSGGKGISCDGVFISEGGMIDIETSGGMLVYSNGTLNHNYTGSSDRIASDYKSSAKGIKADSGVVINDGSIHILTSTNNAEGIESKSSLDINGGTILVKAYDDGINSSGDFRVSGGDLTVMSMAGDGLDSNGNLTVSGGYVRTMGAGGMEMGLDAATENGCAVYLTGGVLLAYGGSNTYPTKSGSTQPFVRGTGGIKANTEILLKSGDDVLAMFTVPEEYVSASSPRTGASTYAPGGGGWPGGGFGGGSIMISCPSLVSGQSYTLVNDTETASVAAALTGSGR